MGVDALLRYPWLLPVVWARGRGLSCDSVVIAVELGVPRRLARTLVYYAGRLGLCDLEGLCVARRGPSFYAMVGGHVVYARIRRRRVSGYTLSPGSGGRERVWGEALEALREDCASSLP